MKTGTVIRIADVHAGALADGVQPFQYFNGIGTVFLFFLIDFLLSHFMSHNIFYSFSISNTARVNICQICRRTKHKIKDIQQKGGLKTALF